MEAVRRVQCNWVAMALLSRQVVDKVSQGGELRNVHFRNFNVKFFVQANDKVQQIHGINVQLVAYAFEPRFDYAVGFWRGIGDLAPRTEDSNSRLGGDDYDKIANPSWGMPARIARPPGTHSIRARKWTNYERSPERRCPGELSSILCLSGFRSQGQVDLDTT